MPAPLFEAIIDGGYVVRYVVFEHDGNLSSAYAAAKSLLGENEVLRGIDRLVHGVVDLDEIRATHEVVTL